MKTAVEIFIITAASIVIFFKSPFNGHTLDDHPAIEWNVVVLGRKKPVWKALLTHDFWGQELESLHSHGSFRPLVTGLLRLQSMLSALMDNESIDNPNISAKPAMVHLINMVLHWLSCLSFFWMVNETITCRVSLANGGTSQISIGFVAGLLFAIHPIHVEAVCGGVGQAELMCTLLMFLGLVVYLRQLNSTTNSKNPHFFLKMTFIAGLSTLAKEQGFMLLPLCASLELFQMWSKRFSYLRFGMCFVVSVLLAAIRIHFFGGPRTQLFLCFDNPASFQPFPIKQLTMLYLPTFCLWLMLYPFRLCADWGDGAIALVKSATDSRMLPATAVYIIICVKTIKSLNPMVQRLFKNRKLRPNDRTADYSYLIALALYANTFLPSSNLLGAVGFVVAERVLYAPSAGFCLLVAIGFKRVMYKLETMQTSEIHKKVISALFVVTCIAFALRTIDRTFDWESDMNLSRSSLRNVDTNARIFINVGAYIRETTGNCHKAIAYFDKAVTLNPRMAKAHFNRARCLRFLLEKRGPDQAAKKRTSEPSSYHLAKSCHHSLSKCISVAKWNVPPNGFFPNHLAECHLDLANLMTVLGELYLGKKAQTQEVADRAMQLIEKAQKVRPDFARGYITKANVLMAMRKYPEASRELDIARKIDPQNAEIVRAMAWILSEHYKQYSEAAAAYAEAIRLKPEFDAAVHEFAKVCLKAQLDEHYTLAAYRLSQIPDDRRTSETVELMNKFAKILESRRSAKRNRR